MIIAIACGDPTGIGPEVTLKAIAEEWSKDASRYCLFGDEKQLRSLNQQLRLQLPLDPSASGSSASRLRLLDCPNQPDATGKAGPVVSALNGLSAGAQACLRQEADALVTAPVCKESIIRAGHPDFTGQTEFLSEMAGVSDTVMMLLGHDEQRRWLRVALATIHLPLRQVAEALTSDRILLAIERASEACRALCLPRARVAVCGLNPHAGEGGKIGDEEIHRIQPMVAKARQQGIDAVGPIPADTLFHYALRGDYDAVVAMYHDQGLAPLKMVAFETGVNWTLGLPFIRTSPDHGTAFDIAGKGIASASSMVCALRLAKQLAARETPMWNRHRQSGGN